MWRPKGGRPVDPCLELRDGRFFKYAGQGYAEFAANSSVDELVEVVGRWHVRRLDDELINGVHRLCKGANDSTLKWLGWRAVKGYYNLIIDRHLLVLIETLWLAEWNKYRYDE
ncbi:hypothetical protein ABN034_21410 [Actinopolymorpha sp. B11F2]|uniref:hypothetical protein n=1 Tax=Actinopolymorpha sp. B11F2 TaxID=3160862 RepID=UPI0032E37564